MQHTPNTHTKANVRSTDGRIVKEKTHNKTTLALDNGHTLRTNEKVVQVDIALNTTADTAHKIPAHLLKQDETPYIARLLDDADNNAQNNDSAHKPLTTAQQLKAFAALDKLLDKMTLKHCKNKNYSAARAKFVAAVSSIDPKHTEHVIVRFLSLCDNSYVILYALEAIAHTRPCLSDTCIQHIGMFARTLKHVYTDTVPYADILKRVFEKGALPNVKVETACYLLAQLGIDADTKRVLVSLYGKASIVKYYREVAEGIMLCKTDKDLLHCLMYVIDDKNLATHPLRPLLGALDTCIGADRTDKNTPNMARAVWALLTVHSDLFDTRFEYILSLMAYFAHVLASDSCGDLSIPDIDDMITALERIADVILNRTVHYEGASTDAGMDTHRLGKIANTIDKGTARTDRPRIIPELANVKYTDSTDGAHKDTASADDSNDEDSSDKDVHAARQEHLNNVALTRLRLEVFVSLIYDVYRKTAHNIKSYTASKSRLEYSTLVYLVAQIKLSHLTIYLARISGSPLEFFTDHHALLADVVVPDDASGTVTKMGLKSFADMVLVEKWNTIGYLAQEGVLVPSEDTYCKELLQHAHPYHLFARIASVIHLFAHPPITSLLDRGCIYDVLYMITLPKYITHTEYTKSLHDTVMYLVSGCYKEELVLLVRRLIELDCLYTKPEREKGSKEPRTVNDYAKVKNTVRDTIVSLFVTEIDLTAHTQDNKDTNTTHNDTGYDTAHIKLTKKQTVDPATNEEKCVCVEETLFTRLGTDSKAKKTEHAQFCKDASKDKQVDHMRRKVIYEYIVQINDLAVSDKVVRSLVRLPSAVHVPDALLAHIMQVLTGLEKRVVLSPEVHREVLVFANGVVHSAQSDDMRRIARVLSVITANNADTPSYDADKKIHTYDKLVMALLAYISTKKGDVQVLKDAFFRVCTDIDTDKQHELLKLYAHIDVEISPAVSGPSQVLDEYRQAEAASACAYPDIANKKTKRKEQEGVTADRGMHAST